MGLTSLIFIGIAFVILLMLLFLFKGNVKYKSAYLVHNMHFCNYFCF